MWKVADVQDGKRYRLGLIQEKGGARRFFLREDAELIEPSDSALTTEIVANDLLRCRDLIRISESVSLTGGDRFYVDPHGVWLTEREFDALSRRISDDEVPWLNGVCPRFPPR